MAFNNYLEEEKDKPYFTTNSLAYYYDKMEGFAKAVEGSAKALNLTKEEIEQRIALRLAEWDGKLQTFDSSVETLLTEWVDDGTLTPLIDSTLIDQKIAPLAGQLAVKVGGQVKLKPEEFSDEAMALVTGNGTVNVLSVPQDGSVSLKKTNFISVFSNLFDYKKVITGQQPMQVFLQSHYNDLEASATSVTSPVFTVENNLKFVTNIPGSTVTYYNADGLRTGGLAPTAISNYFSFTLPAGSKYFRIRYQLENNVNAPTYMVVEGEVFPTSYVGFGGVIQEHVRIDQSQILNPAVTKGAFIALDAKVKTLETTNPSSGPGSKTFKKNTAVILLDSISAQNSMNTAITKRTYAEGYFTWANILLGQRFTLVNNAGIGGNTTTQMLARLQTDVLDYNPSYAFVLGGINDIIQSVSADTIITNLNEIYTRLLADGIVIFASKILPSTMITAGVFTANVNKVNQFIERFAFTHDNFILLNMGKYFANPETGEPAANMTTDGTHPIKLGGFYLGKAIAEELQSHIPQHNDFGLSNAKKDTMNPNPMMLGNANGLATSYSLTNAATTTPTKLSRTDIPGEYQRLTVSEVAGTSYFGLTSSMGTGSVAAGDKYYAQCEVNLSNIEKYDKVKLYLHVTNDAGQIIASAEALYSQDTVQVAMPDWKGVLKTHEITVPTGGVKILSKIEYNIKGVLDVGRYEVKKVTV